MNKRDAFYDHLDKCQQCREKPFELCAIGDGLLSRAAMLLEEVNCESGHTWTKFGDYRKPERGTPCDCGMRKWGDSEHGA